VEIKTIEKKKKEERVWTGTKHFRRKKSEGKREGGAWGTAAEKKRKEAQKDWLETGASVYPPIGGGLEMATLKGDLRGQKQSLGGVANMVERTRSKVFLGWKLFRKNHVRKKSSTKKNEGSMGEENELEEN